MLKIFFHVMSYIFTRAGYSSLISGKDFFSLINLLPWGKVIPILELIFSSSCRITLSTLRFHKSHISFRISWFPIYCSSSERLFHHFDVVAMVHQLSLSLHNQRILCMFSFVSNFLIYLRMPRS